MGLVRLVFFGFLALSVVYLAISVYSRSVRREKLEKSWEEDKPEGADAEARATYLRDGMKKYQNGIRPRLILLVYVIPAALVIAALVFTNSN